MATGYQVFFTKIGTGEWNGNPSADPVTVVGGIDISAMDNLAVSPILQGTGDANLSVNFGQSAFLGAVPNGYQSGWPHSGGSSFTTLSVPYGSATITSGGTHVTFPSFPGMAQSADFLTSGQYYFEITVVGVDIFSHSHGGGVGQNYANGGNFDNWIGGGSFNNASNLGGALLLGGDQPSYTGSIAALGNQTVVSNFANFTTGTTFGVAVFLSPGSGPPKVQVAIPTSLVRWRGQVGLNWKGMALVGDAFTNVVGLSDFGSFTEYGQTMQFQITTPPLHEDRKRIFMPRFEIEVEAGDGNLDDPTVAPLMVLDWSKDGGKTWSTLQEPRSMGLIGQYIKRLRWLNLGNARTWVFRLTCTDPVRRYVIGAYTTDYKSLG